VALACKTLPGVHALARPVCCHQSQNRCTFTTPQHRGRAPAQAIISLPDCTTPGPGRNPSHFHRDTGTTLSCAPVAEPLVPVSFYPCKLSSPSPLLGFHFVHHQRRDEGLTGTGTPLRIDLSAIAIATLTKKQKAEEYRYLLAGLGANNVEEFKCFT